MISMKLFLITMVISIIMTMIVRRISIKIGAVDIPKGGRKIHKKATPLLGGVAIYIAFAITSLFLTEKIEKEVVAIVVAAIPILICGILDDIYELKPISKLLFQFLAGVILIAFGVKINVLANPFGTSDMIFLKYLSVPATLFWVIGITNAFNLIDGLDGLCGGIAFISSLSMYFMSILNGRPMVAALTIILCGATLGFLFFNFNPASIFLGDTGALLLGFLLASFSIVGTIKSATAFAVAVPLLSLGLPIYDTAFAMIRRKVNGKAIMEADKGHLHHRLLGIGLSQKQAVIVMYALSAILGIISIVALEVTTSNSYIILGIVMSIIIFIAYKAGFFKYK